MTSDTINPQPAIRDNHGKFAPGHSGNPSGRPAMPVSLVQELKKQLELNPSEAEAIVAGLLGLGKDKNPQQLGAIRELLDRVDGKVVERHKIEAELPVRIVFVPALELLAGTVLAPSYAEGAQDGNLGVIDAEYEEIPQSETSDNGNDC